MLGYRYKIDLKLVEVSFLYRVGDFYGHLPLFYLSYFLFKM
nr:MAG TPA: hypothetical protein [Bacteriophage sp.]